MWDIREQIYIRSAFAFAMEWKFGNRRYPKFEREESEPGWKASKRKYRGKICLSEIDKAYSGKADESISTVEKINIRLLQRRSNGSNDRGRMYNRLSVAIVN